MASLRRIYPLKIYQSKIYQRFKTHNSVHDSDINSSAMYYPAINYPKLNLDNQVQISVTGRVIGVLFRNAITFNLNKINSFLTINCRYDSLHRTVSNILTMQKYQTLKKLGSGSFGNVEAAQNTETAEVVAIKRLKKKYGTWEQCLQLSEVKALRKLTHPNIIKLKEVIRVVNQAYFVFEYIEKDLFKLMTQRKEKGQKLQQSEIRSICKQLAEALAFIHKQGFFHRDLKPENILISSDLTIKIIDFGLARQIRSKPPFTEYVSTRWYRAPELLFKFSTYSSQVDVFAFGCIIAEMYLGRPLFLGSSQMDQISKIISILGNPAISWPDGVKQAAMRGINLPEYAQIPLSTVLPNCPADAISFISECLRYDPAKRITPSQMLSHPYLTSQIKLLQFPQIKKSQQNGKTDYKISRQQMKAPKPKQKGIAVHEDDEFDGLLNDFKNYQISKKTINLKEEEDDEWQ